jgi:hypothetical protein
VLPVVVVVDVGDVVVEDVDDDVDDDDEIVLLDVPLISAFFGATS